MNPEKSAYSIVIPVYNEEGAIGALLEEIIALLKDKPVEILVVDDGSTDKSGEILANYAQAGKIKLVSHNKNKGYGSALKTGIHQASGERIIIMDGDGSYPAQEILELMKKSHSAEMVVGERMVKAGVEPVLRRIFKWLVVKMVRYLAGFEIQDLNSGLRVFPKEIVRKYFSILPEGFSFTSTLSLIFLSEGYRIEYKEIDYQPRQGKSKFRLGEVLPLSLLLLRTIIYFNPLKFFIPLSLVLVMLALIIAIYSIFILKKFMDVSTTVLLIFAVQVFILGLLADLVLRLRR